MVLEEEHELTTETLGPSRKLVRILVKKICASSKGGDIVSTSPIKIDDLKEYAPSTDTPQSNSPIEDNISLVVDVAIHYLFSTSYVKEEDTTPLETFIEKVKKRKTYNIHKASAGKEPTVDQTEDIIPQSFETQCEISLDDNSTCHESVLEGIATHKGPIGKTLISICTIKSKN